MELQSILASIRLADEGQGISGGEVSAEIEAEDQDTALQILENLLKEFSLKSHRSFSISNYEIISNEDGDDIICITLDFTDISEISWVTFYHKLTDLDPEDFDRESVSELAHLWVGNFFDEDNEIVVELL